MGSLHMYVNIIIYTYIQDINRIYYIYIIYNIYIYIYTVWPEILAGRYFGGLLKICHLAEFTLAVEFLAIMIFIAKWLIERAGNLTLL